jgi:hypothetical protein
LTFGHRTETFCTPHGSYSGHPDRICGSIGKDSMLFPCLMPSPRLNSDHRAHRVVAGTNLGLIDSSCTKDFRCWGPPRESRRRSAHCADGRLMYWPRRMPFGSAKITAGCEIVPIHMPENEPIPSRAKSPRQGSLQTQPRPQFWRCWGRSATLVPSARPVSPLHGPPVFGGPGTTRLAPRTP